MCAHRKFYIAGDDAFKAAEQILTPYPGDNLPPRECAFNFWQSNSRITIECAFGQLVRKWGVLQKPLATGFANHKAVVMACMILHNLCVDYRIRTHGTAGREQSAPRSTSISDCVDFCQATRDAYPKAFVMSREQRNGQPGRRTDREHSRRRDAVADWIFTEGNERDELAEWLHDAGLVRPGRRDFG